jgi:hypothetical protein
MPRYGSIRTTFAGARQVEAERPAVQVQRADQAEMAVDETRDALVPGRDVALDPALDDRPYLGVLDRLDLIDGVACLRCAHGRLRRRRL